MKELARAVAAAAALALCVGSAQAAVFEGSGNRFYEHCQASAHPFFQGLCSGYIQGVLDRGGVLGPPDVCMPDGVTAGQAKDVVSRFLQTHPEVRHAHRLGLVMRALREAWPCLKPETAGGR
jgi:hypothetical protein